MGELTPRRILLVTHPRSCSNLLVRILALESQTGIVPGDRRGGYFFLPLMLLIRTLQSYSRSVGDWTDEEARQVRDCAQACFDKLRGFVESAEARGSSVFVKEHCQFFMDPTVVSRQLFGPEAVRRPPWTLGEGEDGGEGRTRSPLNHTLMSDEFLLTWLPVFLIRHPALAFPSMFRSFVKIDGEATVESMRRSRGRYLTLESTRALYDLYAEKRRPGEGAGDEWPVVVDAEDVIASPAVVVRLCEMTGLDPDKLRFQWEPVPAEKVADRMEGIMLSTLYSSSGIEKGKSARAIVIEDEACKWRDEFGVETGERLETLVRAAMPDYEYLRERRLRAD